MLVWDKYLSSKGHHLIRKIMKMPSYLGWWQLSKISARSAWWSTIKWSNWFLSLQEEFYEKLWANVSSLMDCRHNLWHQGLALLVRTWADVARVSEPHEIIVLRSADKHLLVVPDVRSETGRRTIIVTPTVWNSLSMYEYPYQFIEFFS